MTDQLDRIEIKLIRMERQLELLARPAYVVNMGEAKKDVANSLLKKITGRSFKPGEVIRLSKNEFELYTQMLPCPPPSR